eukprot:TRINITY_DN8443_c0_g1_i1.p1 TRINITY_DN8443_c0_g1~~TRINITY_DN8443_c0_g1_i1.p1  ORF type:complete len:576 (-),score=141.85 TRINITY_DN8443_c0_g1_i1:21-1706(-)
MSSEVSSDEIPSEQETISEEEGNEIREAIEETQEGETLSKEIPEDDLRSSKDQPQKTSETEEEPDLSIDMTSLSFKKKKHGTIQPVVPGSNALITNHRYQTPEGKKTLGEVLLTGRSFLWLLCILVPIAYLCIFFGVIPIGDRNDSQVAKQYIYGYWVFICVVNPINMSIVSCITVAIFLACLGVARPFRIHPFILGCAFLLQIALWIVVLPFTGPFPLFGAVALAWAYIIAFSSTYAYERWKMFHRTYKTEEDKKMSLIKFNGLFLRFVKILIAFFIFFLILVVYIYGYSFANGAAGQKLLPFAMTIGIFIFRKVMLSLTDPFPLEIAMFISGFWVENIYDMFQVMAYRSVKEPINYLTIWLTNVLSIVANIFFLFDFWFEFRIRIKVFLKLLFKGKPTKPTNLNVHAELDEIEDERGHSNNKPGYHRRQARFVFLKISSKAIAALFYPAIAALLRYGTNNSLFPFTADTYDQYINSIIYSFANFGFLLLAGGLVALFIRIRRPVLLQQVIGMVKKNSQDRILLGAVIALVTHNGILAILMMMNLNEIWSWISHLHTDDN